MFRIPALALATAFGLTALAPQTATAEVKIYPYASHENHCPAGLRPVTINGVICCGTPNTHMSYQSAMAHPVAPKKHHRVVHRTHKPSQSCRIGTKGCTYD
jgi:hypothetical protein